MARVVRSVCGAAAVAAALSGSAAASPVVGEPIPPRPGPTLNVVEGSYRVEDLRVADPAGGLPWGFATFLARPAGAPREAVCLEVGRVLQGQLGLPEPGGEIFRPFVPTSAPAVQCGLSMRAGGERAYGYSNITVPSHIVNCAPGVGTACGNDARAIMIGAFGKGILSMRARDRAHVDRLAVSRTGTFLLVVAGRVSDATMPTVAVQATACGPDARLDLVTAWRVTRHGCLLSFDVPTEPRPQPDSAASRRARQRARLDRPVRIIERRGAVPDQRFRARLKAPITVRSSGEGYAYRLTGPIGDRCDRRAKLDTKRGYLSSYLTVEGKPLELAIRAPRRDRPWCRGTYRLTILHVQAQEKNRRLAFLAKPVASTVFNVRR